MRLKDLIGKRVVVRGGLTIYVGTLHSYYKEVEGTEIALTNARLVTCEAVSGDRRKMYVAEPCYPVAVVPFNSVRPVHGDTEIRIGSLWSKWEDEPKEDSVVLRPQTNS